MQANTRRPAGYLWLAAMWIGASAPVTAALAEDVGAEYQRRAQALASDDVDGHLALALWCKDQEAWSLLRDECTHILRLVPDHQQAQLLLQLARTRLSGGKDESAAGPEETPTDESGGTTDFARVITDEEIQILRRIELGLGGPDRVAVRFIDGADARFADEYFGANRMARADFMKLPLPERARYILSLRDGDYAQRYGQQIEITSDPAIFAEFERQVMPIIAEGCATARCHGGPDAKGFRLFTARRLSKNQLYTNFLILTQYEKDGAKGPERLIDRANRRNSLLVFYGQKDPVINELTPGPHPVPIDPVYRSPDDPKFVRVWQWLQRFSVVAQDYGIDIRPGSQPAAAPAPPQRE